jgi:hypothetical protein
VKPEVFKVDIQLKTVARSQQRAALGSSMYFIWLISPFLVALFALRNYRDSMAKNLVWLFIVFYGFTFVLSSEQLDAARYQSELKRMHNGEVSSIADFLLLLYNEETNYVDIAQPLITFLVSRFTGEPRILMTVFAIIFGYFYSRNIWFLLHRVKHRLKLQTLITIGLFALVVAFWQMNGFRFYTALHILVFGYFRYCASRKASTLWVCFLSPLMHFSMIIPVALLLIYLVVGNRLLILGSVFVASFFVSQVTPNLFKPYLNSLPGVFQKRTIKYVSEPYLKARKKATREKPANWYVNGRFTALLYTLSVIIVWILLKHRRIVQSRIEITRLLSFGLMVGSLVNLGASIPSMARFYSLFFLLVLAAMFLLLQEQPRKLLPAMILLPFYLVALLFSVVEIRIGFDTMGVMTILGNPLTAIWVVNDVPLIDLIK